LQKVFPHLIVPHLHLKKQKRNDEKKSASQISFLNAFLKEIAFTPDFLINDYYIEFLKNNHAKTFQRIKKEGFQEQLPE
jgi:hypothetical protein